MKRIVCTLLISAMFASLGVAAFAGDEKQPPMDPAAAQAMMQAMMPGEHHEHMKALAGNWDYTIKTYMAPGQPPMESTGKRSAEMILGGRYLLEKYTGTMMGMPFEGEGIMAYDNIQKKYLVTWIDNMGTGIYVSSGTCDKGPSWTTSGEMADPATGKMMTMKSVTKMTDADHFTMEMFAPGPDGKEMKMMEIAATRAK